MTNEIERQTPRERFAGKQLGAGAEATVYAAGDRVIKDRHEKRYRHPVLDLDLRKARTRMEGRLLRTATVPVPRLLKMEGTQLELERVGGRPLKELIDEDPALARRVGEHVAQLHDQHIIHGDLTTSNMLYGEELVLIDFGLGFTSHSVEDKAVDIHLFKQALESKHHRIFDDAYREFLAGYRTSPHADEVLARLKLVDRRGRHKGKA